MLDVPSPYGAASFRIKLNCQTLVKNKSRCHMRNWIILGLAVVLCCSAIGCRDRKPVVKDDKPLVPTAAESETLRAFQLDPESPKGQKKIRDMRRGAKKIEEAKANVRYWAEEAKRREEEAARRAKSGN